MAVGVVGAKAQWSAHRSRRRRAAGSVALRTAPRARRRRAAAALGHPDWHRSAEDKRLGVIA